MLACVSIHNFLCKECRYDEFAIDPADNSSYLKSPVNVNEDHNFEPVVHTQKHEQKDVNVWRACIALDQWRNAS